VLAEQLALVATTLFAGAALHVSLSEHPARLGLDDASMIVQWKRSFNRAQKVAAPLAILGLSLSLFALWQSQRLTWAVGAILIGANIPFTLIVIRPVNNRLLALDPATANVESRSVIQRWGRLHMVRTGLGLAAVVAMVMASSR
jgi:hypothetical protein